MYFPSSKEETFGDFLDLELLFIEKSMMIVTNEKQISIDPISFKDSPSSAAYPRLDFSPPKLPSKEKFVTASLPNSATSSPRFISKKECKNQADPTPPRQQSVALSRLVELREKHSLRKSKSCGDGRATSPSEDFDMWSPKKIIYDREIRDQPYELPKFAYDRTKHIEPCFEDDDKVKCGALCLFLPGLGKGKPVKNRKTTEKIGLENVISRTVSLEKFECGSWTSSAIMLENGDTSGDLRNLFFELPIELIENGVNDADYPVKSAFVFENKDLKGVLKRGESRGRGRKPHESARHVRFSTSSPPGSDPTSPTTCITPRLRKARDDFNAFLQAQSV